MLASKIKVCVGYKLTIFLLAAVVIGLLLAACGGPDPSQNQLGPSAANSAANSTDTASPANSVAVANVQAAADESGYLDEGFTSTAEIDADAVVAAHEAVLIRLYEDLLPSVVHIRVSQQVSVGQSIPRLPRIPGVPLPDLPEEFFQQGEGSGFVWDDEGHVVTNNHVILGADRVTVVFADRTELEAQVIGTDPDSDLAVLELDEPKDDARPVKLGDSDALKVGQMVVAIGNPFGQEFSMSTGIVSALGRTIRGSHSPFSIPEVIQTDAPINPGHSGGPLLDRHGRVIGVNTQIISRSGVSSGVGFSVPVNTAKQVIPALIKDGRYEYPWLGITGSTLRPEAAEQMDLARDTRGALLIQVSGDSPADLAGLRGSDGNFTFRGVELPVGGDVIVAIDAAPVRDMDDLITYLVSKTRPGDKVTLQVIRNGGSREILEVTLGKRPKSE